MKLLGRFPSLKEYGDVDYISQYVSQRIAKDTNDFHWIAQGWRCIKCCRLCRSNQDATAPTRVCRGEAR